MYIYIGFPSNSVGKESACNAGDPGSICGSGRSPGEGNGHPPQYSCLGKSMDRGHGGLQSMGFQRVRHNCATNFHFSYIYIFSFFFILSELVLVCQLCLLRLSHIFSYDTVTVLNFQAMDWYCF